MQTLAGRMNKYNDININGYDTLTDGRDPLPPSFIQKLWKHCSVFVWMPKRVLYQKDILFRINLKSFSTTLIRIKDTGNFTVMKFSRLLWTSSYISKLHFISFKLISDVSIRLSVCDAWCFSNKDFPAHALLPPFLRVRMALQTSCQLPQPPPKERRLDIARCGGVNAFEEALVNVYLK